MNTKLKQALLAYLEAGVGNSTDYEKQADARRLAMKALAEQPAQGERIGAVHTSGDLCRWMPHFAHPMYADDFKPLYAPPAPSVPDDVRNAVIKAREIAMQYTLEARIPECGYFAAIAQDLDYVCHRLLDPTPQAQEIPS